MAILDERYVNNTIRTIIIGLSRCRFRAMAPFSQTIRRFTNNVSDMKNLAARDYEDMLQVRSLATHVRQQSHNSLSCPLLSHLRSHPLSTLLCPVLRWPWPYHTLSCPIPSPHHTLPTLCSSRPLGQCSIPAFEDLLNGHHNKRVIKLLYRTAEWHGFAKLRMHTQATLDHLDSLTKEYGRLMWSFRDLTCSQFDTKELPREVETQKRAQHHVRAKGLGTGSQAVSVTRHSKTLNLFMPKFHALGDYVHTIQTFGTIDSYSTQVV